MHKPGWLAFVELAACLALAQSATAQTYPDKPVKVMVAYPPGGGADIVARLVAQKLSERLGQQFVVINTPGASGALGTQNAARAEPDGYTISLGQQAEMSILPNLTSNLRYDPVNDFAPIGQITSYPYVIAVHPSVPVRDLKEFLDYAKAHPGELNYGTPGPGSSAHLAVELFMRRTGIKLTHVPFRGSGPAVLATVAGHVQVVFGDAASTTSQAEAGQLRPLAVTATKRSPKLPQVPTASEAGVTGYEAVAWHGLFAPVGVKSEIVNKLSAELSALLQDAALRKRLEQDGIEAVGSTPEAFAAYLKEQLRIWGQVARDAGVKLD